MKQLRFFDANGAPLLFQAASSTSNLNCFKKVRETIADVLGEGGLTEQLRATDREGKTLRMYAARSGNVDIFNELENLFKDLRFQDKLRPDNWGRTLLHHAAEAGCSDTLKQVMKLLKDETSGETFLTEYLQRKDKKKRTPAMCLLGTSHSTGPAWKGYEDKLKSLTERYGTVNDR